MLLDLLLELRTRLLSFKDSELSDTGLPSSLKRMEVKSRLFVNTTQLFTTLMVLMYKLSRTTRLSTEPLKDSLLPLKKIVMTHKASCANRPTALSPLPPKNQFTRETPMIFKSKLFSKELMVLLPMQLNRSLPVVVLFVPQTCLSMEVV